MIKYYYRIYGMRLAADLEFPQLLKDEAGESDIVIVKGEAEAQIPKHPSEKQYDIEAAVSWLENRTCYLLIQNGRRITYQRKEGANEMYLRSYLLGWGLSMLIHQRGKAAIHCSAVCNEEGAVLLCGESGSGKSTMTTALLEQGYRLMADDMALVECRGEQGAWVKAAFPYQKLCRDAALRSGRPMEELLYIDEDKDKFLVPCRERFQEEACRVRVMIILCKIGGETVCVQQQRGMQAFYACTGNLFLRHLLKEKKYEPFIGETCLRIASCVPVYALGRPAGKDTLTEVEAAMQRILDMVAIF